MALFGNTFRDQDINAWVSKVQQYQKKLEADPYSFDPGDHDDLKEELLSWLEKELASMLEAFESDHLKPKYGIQQADSAFAAVIDRAMNQATRGVSNAFATTQDAMVRGAKDKSILQRVTKWLRNMLGLKGKGGYREDGITQTSQGKKFWLRSAQYAASSKPVTKVDVAELQIATQGKTYSNKELDRVILSAPLLLVRTGSGYEVLDGHKRIARAVRDGVATLPARVVVEGEIAGAAIEANGIVRTAKLSGADPNPNPQRRVYKIGLAAYVKMLLNTVPHNAERNLVEWAVKKYNPRKLFRVTGGIVHNSASTCRFCDGKVLDEEALRFATRSDSLRVHLFHPNCRHKIEPVGANYQGEVIGLSDLPPVQNGHFLGYNL